MEEIVIKTAMRNYVFPCPLLRCKFNIMKMNIIKSVPISHY